MRPALIISIILIILFLVLGIVLAPTLPDNIPSHWNLKGEVDGYMAKNIGVLFLPLLAMVIMVLMVALPRYDPDYRRYTEFQSAYDGLILLIVSFLMILYGITLLWSSGIEISMNSLMSVMFALLYVGVGIFLRSVKKVWFVGIRTPWTLLSENVWIKTHQAGSWIFILAGVFCLGGILATQYAYFFVLVPMSIGVCGIIVYSYLLYQKEIRSVEP